MSEDSRPIMVSIQCLVYNHEPYIRQCLDGFVAQKTNFRFEAIVHDDASTDGSAGIIKEYAEKYPDIIKPVLESENQYKKHDGSLRKIVMEHLKGKYIALCEGDDYWIDPMKLQKQVNYMEAHPECTLYVSNGVGYYEKEKKSVRLNPIQTKESKYLTMSEVLREKGGLIPTASMCFRREMMETEPEWCLNAPVGDRPLRMWCASHGKIYYDVTPMVVYRKSSIGSFTQHVNADYNYARHILDEMNVFYDAFDKYTHQEYKDDVQYMKDREEYSFYSRVRDFNSLFHCSFFYNKSWLERIKIHVKIQFPFVYKILYKIKSAIRLYSPLNMH